MKEWLHLKKAKKVLGLHSKPFAFEIVPAQNKLYKDTIVFVPFFFGKKENMKRHVEYVNELGFDAAIFTLTADPKYVLKKIPYDSELGWGLKHLWTREISEVLDRTSGRKILYTFSNPTSSALEAIQIRKAFDITALICDGGPFYNLVQCNWNYFTHEYPISFLPKKILANIIARSIWTPQHEAELFRDLSSLPKDFPVLSIRGWKDPLVPPSAIEKAFKPHSQLDLSVLNIPDGKHMDGLKLFSDLYKEKVTAFLYSVGEPI